MAKTYGTVTTFTAGSVLTAAQLNTAGTAINNLVVPAMVKANQSTLQAIGNVSPVVLAYDGANSYDTDATMHDPAVNNTRITFNTTGVYVVTIRLATATSISNLVECFVNINGTGTRIFDDGRNPASSNTFQWCFTWLFTAGDYITTTIYHSTGSSVNTTPGGTWISAHWIGRTS